MNIHAGVGSTIESNSSAFADISLAHRSRSNDSKNPAMDVCVIDSRSHGKIAPEAVLLELSHFIACLTALVPPARFHMSRYHGIFAANAKARAEVVPQKPIKKGVQLPLFMPGEEGYLALPPSRHPRPWLLKRVFAIDISICTNCTGRMRVIGVAKDEESMPLVFFLNSASGQLSLSFAG